MLQSSVGLTDIERPISSGGSSKRRVQMRQQSPLQPVLEDDAVTEVGIGDFVEQAAVAAVLGLKGQGVKLSAVGDEDENGFGVRSSFDHA